MDRKPKLLAVILLIVTLFSSACGATPPSSPGAVQETDAPIPPTATIRIPATSTVTPTPIPPTITLTPTPSPTLTLTPTPESPISISGTITNLDAAKPFLTKDAHLQLVRMTDDGKLTFAIAQDGSLSLVSDLAKIPLPSADGWFDFRIDSLEPGTYLISAQPFKPENFMKHNLMWVAANAANPQSMIKIEIPENLTLPYKLDLGEVEIVLP